MVLRLAVLGNKYVEQASTLAGVTEEQIKILAKYFDTVIFSEERPSKKDKRIARELIYRVDKEPETHLEILKMRKKIMELSKPLKNYMIYGKPRNMGNYKRDQAFWGIHEINIRKSPPIKVDSSIGKILSGDEEFRLYGEFKDYDNHDKVNLNFKRIDGYPIKELEPSRKKKRISLPLKDALRYTLPAFLFIGDIYPEYCNECLVFINKRFYNAPEEFFKVIRHRAGFFAISYLKNMHHVENEKAIKKFGKDIERLETLIKNSKI